MKKCTKRCFVGDADACTLAKRKRIVKRMNIRREASRVLRVGARNRSRKPDPLSKMRSGSCVIRRGDDDARTIISWCPRKRWQTCVRACSHVRLDGVDASGANFTSTDDGTGSGGECHHRRQELPVHQNGSLKHLAWTQEAHGRPLLDAATSTRPSYFSYCLHAPQYLINKAKAPRQERKDSFYCDA